MPESTHADMLPTGADGTEHRLPGTAGPAGRQAFGRTSPAFIAVDDGGNDSPAGLSGPLLTAGRR